MLFWVLALHLFKRQTCFLLSRSIRVVRMMGDGGNILNFHGDKCIRCRCKISPEDKVPLLENNWQISRPARFAGDEVRGYEWYLESCLGGSFRMGVFPRPRHLVRVEGELPSDEYWMVSPCLPKMPTGAPTGPALINE